MKGWFFGALKTAPYGLTAHIKELLIEINQNNALKQLTTLIDSYYDTIKSSN